MTELSDYLDALVERTSAALGDDLVGIYLHGSAAMDAFVPTRSDVDVLVVTTARPSSAAASAVTEAAFATDPPCPGVGLELSVITAASARTPADAPVFELHVGTQDGAIVDGATRDGDPDLVAHVAMTLARGRALFGPPPAEVFAPVERPRLLRSLADDLAWASDRGLAGYAVLNACRALRYADEGVLCSKLEGGKWAIRAEIGEEEAIASALRRQRGADEQVDPAAAAHLAGDVRTRLLRAVAADPG